MIIARFEGGPFDGAELALAGKTPSYLLCIEPPAGALWPGPLIVGADFDDHWPDQQRYEADPSWHKNAEHEHVITYTHTP